MLAIIVAVVAGTWAALAAVAVGAPQPLAIATGAVCFLLAIATNSLVARRGVSGYAARHAPKFPSPADQGGESP
jgi:hypothetical protein